MPPSHPTDPSAARAARYVVGIDLGTTNSAVAFADADAAGRVETFVVPQLVDAATVEGRETLPSCHYEPAAGELAGRALRLPWDERDPDHVVGFWARELGAAVPGRLAASAKSWLSHAGVDRTAPLLPWHGAPDARQLSPMEVSARYLLHVRRAWNHAHPEEPLEEQDVVLTVPASFDEVARELTVAAAKKAGLRRVVLIEEPQAAFYSWLDREAREGVEEGVGPGEMILVCDVGGGTTDLTLIRAEDDGEGGVRFHRVAVGEHLILGGDNLDLALAHHLERRLGAELQPRQWSVLVRRCQQAKETLLGDAPPASWTVTLPGAGARLIGGALSAELAREEAEELLVEGFLPRVGPDAEPARPASGFRQFGLPYAADSGITRYLAAFLRAHGGEAGAARPDIVLLNGGFFAASALRARLLEVLTSWFDDGGGWAPRLLGNERLDLAVARGAAYYGLVRRGRGRRIEAGLARAYYVGAETREAAPGAVCLVPAGLAEGQDVVVPDRVFRLLIRQPVEFPIFTSASRTTDRPGALVEVDPTVLTALPPIRTVLRSGKKTAAEKVDVRLHARLTVIGTLEVWCAEVEGNRTWRLEFDVRSAVATDVERHAGVGEQAGFVDEATVAECEALIASTFGPDGKSARPEALVKRLEEATELARHDWPPSLLRAFWQVLLDHERGRRMSVNHEARWLNLLGFSLRPGWGYAVDDWRVGRTWRLSHDRVVHAQNAMCRAEWWVMWRRIAGGLTSGQQRALAQPLVAGLKSQRQKRTVESHETAEIWRLLGTLERLETAQRVWLGQAAFEEMDALGPEALSGALPWALARLGSRVPVYGQLASVVDVETVESWLARLLERPPAERRRGAWTEWCFALVQLARRTDDRFRDVAEATRERVAAALEEARAPAHYAELVRAAGELEAGEQRLVLGDSLPKGLVIR